MKYFVTFGQQHPAKDGFVVVEASSYEEAHSWAMKEYNRNFCTVYTEERFQPEYFPLGELLRVGV